MTATRKDLLRALLLFIAVAALWRIGMIVIERSFPPNALGQIPWTDRGAFGGMFGAITSFMTAINLALLVYAFLLQVGELRRQNEITKWQVNYNYLLDAKKLITEHPEVLELHGLPADLPTKLNVTAAQIAYVVIDLKAADLYYKMDGSKTVTMTEYRKNMLRNSTYCKIARECILVGTMLPKSAFTETLRAHFETGDVHMNGVKVDPGQVDAERKHLEGLLKDRINFYLVFSSVFMLGLSRIEVPQFRMYILVAVTIVSLLMSLAVFRTYLLVKRALHELNETHPYVRYRKDLWWFPLNANWLLVPIPFILTILFIGLSFLCYYRCP